MFVKLKVGSCRNCRSVDDRDGTNKDGEDLWDRGGTHTAAVVLGSMLVSTVNTL
jgi:hypothetical protein